MTAKTLTGKMIPSRSLNFRSGRNYSELASLLTSEYTEPRVLIIGGRILGKGIEGLIENDQIEILETDIHFGPRTKLICDAQSLPFEDSLFEAVIVQAVLEHVIEPEHCVEEIYRVLTDRGFVYSETPFLQQVHGSPYDFSRYTYLGHRRLFRKFEEVDSGPVAGPGTVLTWAWESFLCSFSDKKMLKAIMRRLGRFTGFWLKYFDYYLLNKESSWDGASAFYFLGRKTNNILSDRELLSLFRN